MTNQEFEKVNNRRLDLIEKKFQGGGIDNEEQAELDRLHNKVSQYLRNKHPLPTEYIDEMQKLIDRSNE